jgi:hypothetical protein
LEIYLKLLLSINLLLCLLVKGLMASSGNYLSLGRKPTLFLHLYFCLVLELKSTFFVYKSRVFLECFEGKFDSLCKNCVCDELRVFSFCLWINWSCCLFKGWFCVWEKGGLREWIGAFIDFVLLFVCLFVSSALNSETTEHVAIKKIANAFDNKIDAKRTLREIKLLRHMDHENVSE